MPFEIKDKEHLQTVIFRKSHFPTQESVKKFIYKNKLEKIHNWKGIDEKTNTWRARQQPPSKSKKVYYKTKKYPNGIDLTWQYDATIDD